MNKIIPFVFIFLIILINGCGKNYNFINSLNISCDAPIVLIDEINNLNWENQDVSIIHGSLCEAVTKECTAEVEIFKSDSGSLRHRIHYFGSTDNIYYLVYNNKKYDCIQK